MSHLDGVQPVFCLHSLDHSQYYSASNISIPEISLSPRHTLEADVDNAYSNRSNALVHANRAMNDISAHPARTSSDAFYTSAPATWDNSSRSAGSWQESESIWTQDQDPHPPPMEKSNQTKSWFSHADFQPLNGETTSSRFAPLASDRPVSGLLLVTGVGVAQNNFRDKVAAAPGVGVAPSPSLQGDGISLGAAGGPKIYKCQWPIDGASCGALVVGDKREIVLHLRDAHNVSPKGYKMPQTCFWQNCQKIMKKESIGRHILEVHMKKKVHCTSCGSSFARNYLLQKHLSGAERRACTGMGKQPGSGPDAGSSSVML
ncbi:hypothetical protein BS17DRAFT_788396 [Gyrodon lividus]|nr:hypothetical protein BS17DRAFT_788396 [Gyrodon lividus]